MLNGSYVPLKGTTHQVLMAQYCFIELGDVRSFGKENCDGSLIEVVIKNKMTILLNKILL